MSFEPSKGCNFFEGVAQAKTEAKRLNQNEIKMQFNEVEMWVNVTSYIDDLSQIYSLKKKIFQLENQ